MTDTLQDAIAAVRAGDPERAQLIAVDIVRANPDDANAWYLLSQLVDSDARRAAYLGKTLAIDPNHARARIEFDALPPAVTGELAPAAVAEDEAVVVEAPVEAAVDVPELAVAGAAVADAAAAPETVTAGAPVADANVPEWLQPLGPKPAPPSAQLTPARPATGQARPSSSARPAPAKAKKKNGNNQALSILFVLLVLLTVVVLGFLVYLLLL